MTEPEEFFCCHRWGRDLSAEVNDSSTLQHSISSCVCTRGCYAKPKPRSICKKQIRCAGIIEILFNQWNLQIYSRIDAVRHHEYWHSHQTIIALLLFVTLTSFGRTAGDIVDFVPWINRRGKKMRRLKLVVCQYPSTSITNYMLHFLYDAKLKLFTTWISTHTKLPNIRLICVFKLRHIFSRGFWCWILLRQGYARAIGDGALVATVHDVIVHPELQRQGLGRALIQRLLTQVSPLISTKYNENSYLGQWRFSRSLLCIQ